MKTKKSLYVLLLCPFLFACGNNDDLTDNNETNLTKSAYYKELIESSQCTNIPRPADTYIYPVVPGTDKWIELQKKGTDKVRDACRVPETILQKQSTPAVIQTFFDYPFSMDLYASSSTLLDGFKRGIEHNSAYTELLKRKDAGKCLLDIYILFDPVGCAKARLMSPLLELLSAQPEFYSQLKADKKKAFVKKALQKTKARMAFDPELANQLNTTCLLIGRIMVSAEFAPFVKEVKSNEQLSQYLKLQSTLSNYDSIISYATEFTK